LPVLLSLIENDSHQAGRSFSENNLPPIWYVDVLRRWAKIGGLSSLRQPASIGGSGGVTALRNAPDQANTGHIGETSGTQGPAWVGLRQKYAAMLAAY
jgi:hypothetical protein